MSLLDLRTFAYDFGYLPLEMSSVRIGLALLGAIASLPLYGQGTAADYARAENYRQWVAGKVLNLNLRPAWMSDGGVWYRAERPNGESEFVRVRPTGVKEPAFDHNALAAKLSDALGQRVESRKLPFERIQWDGDRILFNVEGKGFSFDTRTQRLEPKELPANPTNALHPADMPRTSASGGEAAVITFVNATDADIEVAWINLEGGRIPYQTIAPGQRWSQNTYVGHAWIVLRNGQPICGYVTETGGTLAVVEGTPPRRPAINRPQQPGGTLLFRVTLDSHQAQIETPSGDVVFRTTDGTPENPYVGTMSASPSGRFVVLQRRTVVPVRQIPIITSRPREGYHPTYRLIDYVKPGDPLGQVTFTVVDTQTKEATVIPRDLYGDQYAVNRFSWSADGNEFRFIFNERGHQVLRWLGYNAVTKRLRTIVEEKSPTFVDYSQKFFLWELPDTGEAIWMSERSGWNHLYLLDTATGQVKNPITSGNWVVREVVNVDPEKRTLLLRVFGINPGEDPYHSHFIRVGFDGKNMVRLTEGDGNHTLEFSPDGTHYIDTYSRVDLPHRRELRRSEDGKKVADLDSADASALLDEGWKMPVRFVAKGRDGVTDIYGYISFPTTYDPTRKYPVIESIYAGPHGNHVRKSFAAGDNQGPLAELGFIVVYIDGMGTNWRSKAFHDVCWQNIADGGFPDRIAWIKAAAQQFPAMDLERVGITGGSAGGQNTAHALLLHGDFYKVGVADCGCYDNRLDKIWWNEAWMGRMGPHYEAQACSTLAANLTGKLMLLLGEEDTNVDPTSTFQFIAALNAANKDFDFVYVPGAGHGTMGVPVVRRRVWDFFVRHLLGVEPRRSQ